MNNNDSGKILSFDRNAEFHFQKFQKHADDGNYIESLVSIRNALVKDPKNAEYLISLAELYTEMELYEDSNAILFDLLIDKESFDGDVLFGMGCNFFGLHDYEKATECFERYLFTYPDGDFSYDAEDMLDMLDDDIAEENDGIPGETTALIDKSKYLLDTGDYRGAVRLMEKLIKDCPEPVFLKNNLSLAYFCAGKKDKSMELSREVLMTEPDNLHALCNMALFYGSSGDSAKTAEYIERVHGLLPCDGDDLLKVMLTFCEAGFHSLAYGLIPELVNDKPYDSRVLFLCAMACANTGKLDEASDFLLDILRIDPDDTIALYYKSRIHRAIQEGETVYSTGYVYQVPLEEIRDRFIYLNECASKTDEELRALWTSPDRKLRSILLWGLNFADSGIKRVCAGMLHSFGDDESESLLRRFLLRENEPDDVKHDIFVMLSSLGAKQPFVAYISGKIAEVRVGSIRNKKGLSKGHEMVIELLAGTSYAHENKLLITECVSLLDSYFDSLGKAPSIRSYGAWAAALLFISMNKLHPDFMPPLSEVCAELKVTEKSVLRCIKLIKAGVKDGNKKDE